MKAVEDACKNAGLEVPEQVNEFFGDTCRLNFSTNPAISQYVVGSTGLVLDVNLSRLDSSVKTLQIVIDNSQ